MSVFFRAQPLDSTLLHSCGCAEFKSSEVSAGSEAQQIISVDQQTINTCGDAYSAFYTCGAGGIAKDINRRCPQIGNEARIVRVCMLRRNLSAATRVHVNAASYLPPLVLALSSSPSPQHTFPHLALALLLKTLKGPSPSLLYSLPLATRIASCGSQLTTASATGAIVKSNASTIEHDGTRPVATPACTIFVGVNSACVTPSDTPSDTNKSIETPRKPSGSCKLCVSHAPCKSVDEACSIRAGANSSLATFDGATWWVAVASHNPVSTLAPSGESSSTRGPLASCLTPHLLFSPPSSPLYRLFRSFRPS